MNESAKYDAYRVLQPRIKERGLFLEVEDEALRVRSLHEAIDIGRQGEGQWGVGLSDEIDNGVSFQVGYSEIIRNYQRKDGAYAAREVELTKVTDVFIDYSTGLMLIRRDRTAPSPFLVSRAVKAWLKEANIRQDTGLDSLVQAIPMVEDFLEVLKSADTISRLSFVVHGPNPADEDDIVLQVATFTQENEIHSTTVSLNSPSINTETAQRIAVAAGNLGNSVSATIQDKTGSEPRTIRMKKKARVIRGPRNPSGHDGRDLLDRLKNILKVFLEPK